MATENGKTSMGSSLTFHVSSISSPSESVKSERTSVATEEREISDSESLSCLSTIPPCLNSAMDF